MHIAYLAAQEFLTTTWAFLPAMSPIMALVNRTGLEDRTRQEGLEGHLYDAARVRCVPIPRVRLTLKD